MAVASVHRCSLGPSLQCPQGSAEGASTADATSLKPEEEKEPMENESGGLKCSPREDKEESKEQEVEEKEEDEEEEDEEEEEKATMAPRTSAPAKAHL